MEELTSINITSFNAA